MKKILAWLVLLPLALPSLASEVSKTVPELPSAVPTLQPIGLSALPGAIPGLEMPASDAAAALAPIPTIDPASMAPASAAPAQVPVGAAVSRLQARFSGANSDFQKSIAADPTGYQAAQNLDAIFSGSRARGAFQPAAVWKGGRRAPQVVNDEGMLVTGRTADQYREIKRLQAVLEAKGVNLSESMNVMDDAYAEVWAKLTAVESVAREHAVGGSNTHLEKTLTWVDGVMVDDAGRRVAVHTQRVFFHPAPNRESEVAEGIRRVAKTLDQEKIQFAEGGSAEQALGKLDEVVLAFDTRGYDEIKQYIKSRQGEFGPRYRFLFVDDVAKTPTTVEAMRADVRRLAAQFPDNQQDLENIYNGVTYSRYVGLLLELKTMEYYVDHGYQVLESGRDFFDPNGQYKTEFDAVVRSPKGEIVIVEAKSARVPLSLAKGQGDKTEVDENGMLDVMEEKFLYKLRMYKRDRRIIEDYVRKHYGDGPISIAFATDPGGTVRQAARQGILVWWDYHYGLAQKELREHLDKTAPELSREYGYPVSFLFLNSHPGEDPMLFYKRPMSVEDWNARLPQHGGKRDKREKSRR